MGKAENSDQLLLFCVVTPLWKGARKKLCHIQAQLRCREGKSSTPAYVCKKRQTHIWLHDLQPMTKCFRSLSLEKLLNVTIHLHLHASHWFTLQLIRDAWCSSGGDVSNVLWKACHLVGCAGVSAAMVLASLFFHIFMPAQFLHVRWGLSEWMHWFKSIKYVFASLTADLVFSWKCSHLWHNRIWRQISLEWLFRPTKIERYMLQSRAFFVCSSGY